MQALKPRVRRTRTRTQLHILVAISAVLVLGAIALASPASAHALVERTTPQGDETLPTSPEAVTIEFSEPVEVSFGGIRVYDTNANRVDAGVAEHVEGRADAIQAPLDDNLPDGTYTVTWRVVSADGHPIDEAFVFHVGAPGTRPEGIAPQVLGDEAGTTTGVLFGIARWLMFAAMIGLAGVFLFSLLVWVRADRPGSPEVARRYAARTRRVLIVSTLLLVVSTIASYVFQGAVAGALTIGGRDESRRPERGSDHALRRL